MENELLVINDLVPHDVFIDNGIDRILKTITEKAKTEVSEATIETAQGRKVFASVAYKVAQSKTAIDNLGKDLVADWKTKSKKVDEVRKQARDYLDSLKDEIRSPLTEYERAEEERKAKEESEKQLNAAWDEAIIENSMFDRERSIKLKEAEFARIEAEKKAKEESERIEKERLEREKRIAIEAEQRAKKQAEEQIAKAKLEAELSEKRRVEAEQRAIIEKEMAIKKAQEDERRRMQAEELSRKQAEEAEKQRLEKIARNKKHITQVNAAIIEDLANNGIDFVVAGKFVCLVQEKKIRNIFIQY